MLILGFIVPRIGHSSCDVGVDAIPVDFYQEAETVIKKESFIIA